MAADAAKPRASSSPRSPRSPTGSRTASPGHGGAQTRATGVHRRRCPTGPASASCCSTAGPRLRRAPHRLPRPTPGRCRRAASTATRRRAPQRCASSRRRSAPTTPIILAESRDWLAYDLPPHLVARVWGGRYRGQRQKWFAALPRPRRGNRSRHQASRVRRVAMGRDREAAGPDRAVQARPVHGAGRGVPPSRERRRRALSLSPSC